MNDFTKEELEHILYAYKSCDISAVRGLKNKLQFMIDNYCIHNERVATSDENGHMLVMCGRCDVLLWHEKD